MKTLLIILGISVSFISFSQNQLPLDTINNYFDDVKAVCQKDNGKLWGKPLLSPILVIDRESRNLVANESDNENLLKKSGNLFTGQFPKNLIIANSTTEFGGKFWTMVGYPLPATSLERNLLFTHEMFHRLQKELKLEPKGYENNHMDKKQARILLKLEWNALEKALKTVKGSQYEPIGDALLFRKLRRQLFSGADTMENKFEIHEGLAEYTAIKLCLLNEKEIISYVLKKKSFFWNTETYVRSFGYFSGSCYAILADFAGVDLKKVINLSTDLGSIVKQAYKIELPDKIEMQFKKIRNKYGFDTISVFEDNRERKTEGVLKTYREKFTTTEHFTLNLKKPNVGFDPKSLQPLDSLGTVYPFVEITDNWGVLKVRSGGCLLSSDWTKAIISAEKIVINGNEISGNDWLLILKDKWKVVKDGKNYNLVKEK